jgi:hypothetical protein
MSVVNINVARAARGERRSTRGAYRAEQAPALREQGYTYAEIAETLEFSDRSAARKAADRGLANWMLASDEELRARELERTEVMLRRLEPLVDCASPDLRAMDLMLRVIDRRTRMLGLDRKRPEPTVTAVDVPQVAGDDTATVVDQYIELADRLFQAGYGSGIAPTYDEDDDEPPAGSSAAMSGGGADEVSADDDESGDDDEVVGHWVNGKFICEPLDEGLRRLAESDNPQSIRDAFDMPK